jgi:hypothetical protein
MIVLKQLRKTMLNMFLSCEADIGSAELEADLSEGACYETTGGRR